MFFIRMNNNIKARFNLKLFSKPYSTDSSVRFGKLNKKSTQGENRFFYLKEISTTQSWRKAVELIKNEQFSCTRSSLPIFNNLVTNAFLEADQALGWEMLNKIIASNFQPNCESFKAYWDFCSINTETFSENAAKMFEFIGKNDVIISKNAIEYLTHRIQHFNRSAVRVNMGTNGVCERCQHQIQPLQQSMLEFQTLKKEFEKILVKKHIKPVEQGVFRQMVNRKKTYDFVIDALNVSRIFPESKGNILKQGSLLARLVEQLRNKHNRVLIVGKKHVNDWPEEFTNFIRKNATVYLTNNNAAVDDILMMYATLISGPNSHFVTNDLLTEYPLEFSESGKDLFRSWQKQHQHFVSYNKQMDSIQIHRPRQFILNANKQIWHIPFTEKPLMTLLKGLVHVPIEWICIDLNK